MDLDRRKNERGQPEPRQPGGGGMPKLKLDAHEEEQDEASIKGPKRALAIETGGIRVDELPCELREGLRAHETHSEEATCNHRMRCTRTG